MSKTTVMWNLLDHDDVEEWGVSTLLSEAVIKKGVCTYAYSPSLREKLYKPELYARINLSVMSKFTASYALALYENTLRFRNVGSTGWREVAVWRSVLGVEEGEYRQFKEFNKKVLKPAMAEVNSTSDILLEMQFRREKRRISDIRFQVREHPQMRMPFPIKDRLLEQVRQTERGQAPAHTAVFRRMLAFGLTATQAQQAEAEYDEAYIAAILDVVERDFNAGKVENLPAYTCAALRKDFRPKPSARERAQTAAKAALKQQQAAAQEQLAAEERDALAAARALNAALAALDPQELKLLEGEFATVIAAGTLPGAEILKEQFLMKGFESVIVQSMFRNFARERLLAVEKK